MALVKKIPEKCPLNYSLIRNTSCFSPNKIISQKVSCISKFEKHYDKLFQFKHISGTVADNAKLDFDAFLSNGVFRLRDKFDKFQL